MRSHLFVSALTIALAVGMPIVSAIAFPEVAVAQSVAEQKKEADRLFEEGNQKYEQGQFEAALQPWQKSLKIYREIKSRKEEGKVLNHLGKVYRSLAQYAKAIENYNQSLVIFREMKDWDGERKSLNGLSDIHLFDLHDTNSFAQYYDQNNALGNLIETSDQMLEKMFPGSRKAYILLGKFRDTFEYFEKRLQISRLMSDREEESRSLGNLIVLSLRSVDYKKVIQYQEQILAIVRELKDKYKEIDALESLADYHSTFGKNNKSIDYYGQALTIARELQDQEMESSILRYIGDRYYILKDYSRTIEYYESSLAIYHKLKREKYADGLPLFSLLSEPSLIDLGSSYDCIGNTTKAIEYYQRSLADTQKNLLIAHKQKDRKMEALSLRNIGFILVKLKQPELAIAFYKQSVNVHEAIRQDIAKLPRESQESYAKSVADTYRSLANLLIQQRRLPEAQAVLELLKLRELRDFTRDTKAIDSPGISLSNIEKSALTEILKSFTTIGNFSQKLTECEQKNCPTLKTLETQRDNLNTATLTELRTQTKLLNQHYATESATLTPEALNNEARRIVNAQPDTVLIYPLILKDKIQFLLAFKSNQGGVTFRPFETTITAENLTTTITQFRHQLENPSDIQTLKTTSQTLYNALIKPLEPELKAANIKHLVFAPDSTIRYIPLAALHDGKKYLIERYTISTITAASQTNTTEKSPRPIAGQNQLLAMGASTFPNTQFASLPNVSLELDAITTTSQPNDRGIYPGTEILNSAFNFDSLKSNLKTGTYKILHLATHGAFIPGNVEQSYIIPGSGPNLTSDRIDALANTTGFSDLHLVTLSACQTGVGDRASDGIEIPGISHFFLKNNVKSVLASLWNVSDASTALLMQKFYTYLAQGKTKAEALQQVQIEFLNSTLTTKDLPRAGARLYIPGQLPPDSLAHPYFWAPFILIGNSL
jgi:CHAT domain-containing protein